MPRPSLRFALLLALGCLAGGGVRAGDMITFETRPNGSTPNDDDVLRNPYMLSDGGSVRFFFDRPDANGVYNNTYDARWDALPVFEQVGTDGTDGFLATNAGDGVHDRAPKGSGFGPQLGQFFLRQPDPIGVLPGPFIIAYDTTQTIREFSGEIWDIDAVQGGRLYEQWRVDVLNASGSVLATRLSPKGLPAAAPGSLDSLPWVFGFKDLPDGVSAIRITFEGTKTGGIGLAFNNFSPTYAVPGSVVPEPSSVVLLGAASAVGLVAAARRRWSVPRRRDA